MNKGLMIYTGYTLQSHCYQSLCHTTDVIYLSVFNSSQSTKQVWPATSDLSKFSEKLIKIISQYDDINFHSTIYYNFKMKYKVVILALFMAHWESISGCSGSKSPDGTVETTGRGLIGKKQLLCMVHGSSNKFDQYTITIRAPCFFCNWQTTSVIKSIQNIVEVECRHDEHPDEDTGKVCKCGEKPSCAGTDKPFCVDGQCQGSCVQRKIGLQCFII